MVLIIKIYVNSIVIFKIHHFTSVKGGGKYVAINKAIIPQAPAFRAWGYEKDTPGIKDMMNYIDSIHPLLCYARNLNSPAHLLIIAQAL